MNNLVSELKKRRDEDLELCRFLEKQLKNAPSGKMYTRRSHGKCNFSIAFRDSDGVMRERYLSRNASETIKEYAKSNYYRSLLCILEKEIKAADRFIGSIDCEARARAWEKMPAECASLVENLFKSRSQICREWENESFDTNTFPIENDNRYVTKKGESVRSRIELLIANLLFDLGIPYRYECKLNLDGHYVYPDFTVMHPQTLEIFYVECFGMMDDHNYAESALRKISYYFNAGKYDRLVMFFDSKTAPISLVDVESLLRAKFLG